MATGININWVELMKPIADARKKAQASGMTPEEVEKKVSEAAEIAMGTLTAPPVDPAALLPAQLDKYNQADEDRQNSQLGRQIKAGEIGTEHRGIQLGQNVIENKGYVENDVYRLRAANEEIRKNMRTQAQDTVLPIYTAAQNAGLETNARALSALQEERNQYYGLQNNKLNAAMQLANKPKPFAEQFGQIALPVATLLTALVG
jgi:hypothetical protein